MGQRGQKPHLAVGSKELEQGAEVLGEPEPQDGVDLDAAAMLRLGHSNDWIRAEVNARINRGLLERQKKEEKEIAAVIKPFLEQMERTAIAIAVIDAEYPAARAKAKEIIEMQRKTRERIKASNLTQCPQCGHEF